MRDPLSWVGDALSHYHLVRMGGGLTVYCNNTCADIGWDISDRQKVYFRWLSIIGKHAPQTITSHQQQQRITPKKIEKIMVKCVRNIDPIPKIVVRFYSFSISMIFDAFEIDAV